MPFTPSHIAAVLPIARTPLVASALAIGSMAPDVPYYVPVPLPATHTALAVFTLDPLLGLVVFAVWHGLLVAPAVASAPRGLRARVPADAVTGLRPRLSGVRTIAWLVVSLVIGSATHVIWDAFTHHGRWGPNHIRWLAAQLGPFEGYRWGQYASGVFGGLVIAVWLVRWWRATPPTGRADGVSTAVAVRGWALVVGLGALGATWAMVTAVRSQVPTDVPTVLFDGATRGLGTAAATALLLALAWWVASDA